MQIIHVVPALTDEASGPSYSVPRLCEALIAADDKLSLVALDWHPGSKMPSFMKVFRIGWGPRRLGRSPSMYRWLRSEIIAGRSTLLHSHGMWQMCAVYPAWVKKPHTQLVVSPRGAFSPWAMHSGSWFKKPFWRFLQRPALERATCFHATSDAEYNDIRELGFRQPVAILPNGIDVPPLQVKSADNPRTVLFLGRIHPVKGVDVLLKAWASVVQRYPEWQLLIGGSDTSFDTPPGYLAEMEKLASELKLVRVTFVGALYGEAKLEAYRNAHLFVLPSHSENFGLTVAEAQAAGTAAIVTKSAPWSGLQSHGSGWWIEPGVDSLIAALEEAMRESPEELQARGVRGRDWMIEDFSWDRIGQRMHQTYRYLAEGGEIPAWVRTD